MVWCGCRWVPRGVRCVSSSGSPPVGCCGWSDGKPDEPAGDDAERSDEEERRMIPPDLSVFGRDPWWLIVIKAVAVFAFLLLTVLVAILAERKILGRMQMRYGP